jgi:hypothetical protein
MRWTRVTTSIPAQPAQDLLFHVDAELLKRLMKRTKSGAEITGRELAAEAGIASGTISNVLTGARPRLRGYTVAPICDVLGVELLVLCTPVERLEPATQRLEELSAA